jgi:hypothetical protein
MTKFFALLFVIFFIIPFLLRVLLRFFFGNYTQRNRTSQANRNTSTPNSSSSSNKQPPQKKKIFSKNEGEYIDYEEVKD